MTDNFSSQAKAVYNISEWSDGYFDISDSGKLCVHPSTTSLQKVPVNDIVNELIESGLRLPILLRFTDVLQDKVKCLNKAFDDAIKQFEYGAEYTSVYPIKVNQQQSVVRKLVQSSPQIGLEAGSKPELLAILGIAPKPIKIICNGYKDAEFLQLAIIAQQLGHQVFVVVEKLSELKLLLSESEKMGAIPNIGIRIRLNSVGKGKWQNSGGEKGKFGLTSSQLLEAINILNQANKLEHFKLVHFHLGSQIANIRDIQLAIKECARYYCELTQLDIPLHTIDVGGGLGVDYEGSASRSSCSMNYDMGEYARNIVTGIAEVCDQAGLPHPNIISESGRALTAHHAVLITNIIEKETPPKLSQQPKLSYNAAQESIEMAELSDNITSRNAIERYHDAVFYFSDGQQKFTMGLISLKQWAELETLYFNVLHQIQAKLDPTARVHRELVESLNEKLACKLFCNFSLFQSLPDAWGIGQIFPIVPLTHLDKPLTTRAIIQDITCDSDGQIRQYSDGMGIETSLPVPEYNQEQDYLLGMFMVGAYQEILGDLHNLFGDTDSAHVEFDSHGGWQVNNKLYGDTVESVLKTVHFNKPELLSQYQSQLKQSDLTPEQQVNYFDILSSGLEGYTYFEL